ncbi:hypothetical protein DM02DRAFT_699876, partial [Periconia macrospinosa]
SVEPNQKDKSGRTPFSWAVCFPSKATGSRPGYVRCRTIIELLLKHNSVDPNISDKKGRSPLGWAANGNHESAVELLPAKKNINPAPVTQDGQIPLAHGRTH